MVLLSLLLSAGLTSRQQELKKMSVTSPDGKTVVEIEIGKTVKWSAAHQSAAIFLPSDIGIRLESGEVLGQNATLRTQRTVTVSDELASPFYKKAKVQDYYRQMELQFKGDYGLLVRVYNEGMAYRWMLNKKDSLVIHSEVSDINFPAAAKACLSYVISSRADKYNHSYECPYRTISVDSIRVDSLIYFPMLVTYAGNKKALITEADVEDYPAMYFRRKNGTATLAAEFPPYPLEEKQGGYNMTQSIALKRAPYAAVVSGKRSLPWRVVAVSNEDKELLNSDLVYKLAAPSRIKDVSWIKPGKVAWDWWNDWNLTHVNFRAGINTQTYKYYIDFAASHKLEYIMLDEGWAEKGNIMKIVPQINLQEIIDYGKQKNVGVWLWGGMYPTDVVMEQAFAKYAGMGIKGFKIDFINRDDQKMMQFYYRAAKTAAKYKLMLDFHGACKPTGLMRTYPNVLNYEGVYGLEMAKFPTKVDFPGHAVNIPFIRMVAGAMDYTPGAMKNVAGKDFYPSVSNPMSQGTRCQQLAMYVLFEAPLNMLSDSPSNYEKEPESTDFIASVPTVFDETVALDGQLGNFAAIARKKGNTWYAGAITNWTERDLVIDLSFLGKGKYKAVIFSDGVNAHKSATDYNREVKEVTSASTLKVHLAPGGGWAASFIAL